MAYSVLADLQKQLSNAQLIQLTDDAGAGTVDQSVIDKAIADADAVINSFVAARYTTPLVPVPSLINSYSVDLAIYNLYSRRANVPPHRKDRYDSAMKMLQLLANGTMTLGEAAPQRVSDQIGGPQSSTDQNDRIMTTGKNGSLGTMDNF